MLLLPMVMHVLLASSPVSGLTLQTTLEKVISLRQLGWDLVVGNGK
jgi:hypothetical protein